MSFKPGKILVRWTIHFIDCLELEGGRGAMTRFEVVSPEGKGMSVRPLFSEEFVEDYFRIPGDGNLSKNRSRVIKEKEELFKTWGLVRIEELIDKTALEEEPHILQRDFGWAEEVEKGQLQPSSVREDDCTFVYSPERKIGFHPS